MNHSSLDGTRLGEMLASAEARGLKAGAGIKDILGADTEALYISYAAMGVEYIYTCTQAGTRSPQEAMNHWLQFCVLSNPDAFGTKAKRDAFRPVIVAALNDARDIISGKISPNKP